MILTDSWQQKWAGASPLCSVVFLSSRSVNNFLMTGPKVRKNFLWFVWISLILTSWLHANSFPLYRHLLLCLLQTEKLCMGGVSGIPQTTQQISVRARTRTQEYCVWIYSQNFRSQKSRQPLSVRLWSQNLSAVTGGSFLLLKCWLYTALSLRTFPVAKCYFMRL